MTRFSPRILTRGIAPTIVARIGQAIDAARAGGRDVVLISHAPVRARVLTGGAPDARGLFGRMDQGAKDLERLIVGAAARGQRVVHLAGHTHWRELFVARPDERGRWRFERLLGAPTTGAARRSERAVLVTAQSTTKSGLAGKAAASGYGFTWVELAAGETTSVAFVELGPVASRCGVRPALAGGAARMAR